MKSKDHAHNLQTMCTEPNSERDEDVDIDEGIQLIHDFFGVTDDEVDPDEGSETSDPD